MKGRPTRKQLLLMMSVSIVQAVLAASHVDAQAEYRKKGTPERRKRQRPLAQAVRKSSFARDISERKTVYPPASLHGNGTWGEPLRRFCGSYRRVRHNDIRVSVLLTNTILKLGMLAPNHRISQLVANFRGVVAGRGQLHLTYAFFFSNSTAMSE